MTKTELTKTEPAKTELAKTEPAKTELTKTEPAKTEPTKTEPAKTAKDKNRNNQNRTITLSSIKAIVRASKHTYMMPKCKLDTAVLVQRYALLATKKTKRLPTFALLIPTCCYELLMHSVNFACFAFTPTDKHVFQYRKQDATSRNARALLFVLTGAFNGRN